MRPSTRSTYEVAIILSQLRRHVTDVRHFAAMAAQEASPLGTARAYYRPTDDTGIVVTYLSGQRAAWQLSWLVVHATSEGFGAITDRMLRPERWRWFIQKRLATFDQVGPFAPHISVALSRVVWAAGVSRNTFGSAAAVQTEPASLQRTSDDSATCSGVLIDDTGLHLV